MKNEIIEALREIVQLYDNQKPDSAANQEIKMWRRRYMRDSGYWHLNMNNDGEKEKYIYNCFMSTPTEYFNNKDPNDVLELIVNSWTNK